MVTCVSMLHTHIFSPVYTNIAKLFDVRIVGAEHISPSDNYIFAMNHQSIIDVFICYALLHRLTPFTTHVYLDHKFYNALWPIPAIFGSFKIDVRKHTSQATSFNQRQIIKGANKLREGNNVLIFPEGSIHGGRTGTISRGATGVVRLSIISGRPVIPIGISGSNKAYPYLLETRNPLVMRRHIPITVQVGSPMIFSEHASLDISTYSTETGRVLRILTDQVMDNLSALSALKRA